MKLSIIIPYYNGERIGYFLNYLKYLTQIRKELTEEGKNPIGLLDAMQNEEANEALGTIPFVARLKNTTGSEGSRTFILYGWHFVVCSTFCRCG